MARMKILVGVAVFAPQGANAYLFARNTADKAAFHADIEAQFGEGPDFIEIKEIEVETRPTALQQKEPE